MINLLLNLNGTTFKGGVQNKGATKVEILLLVGQLERFKQQQLKLLDKIENEK